MSLSSVREKLRSEEGRAGYVLMWLLGVPIPVLFLIYVLRGCN